MSLNLKTDSDGINPPRAAWSSQSSTTTTAHGKDLIQQDAEDLEAQANQQVLELARRLTDQSHGQPASLFPVPDDGALNPSSPQFNARKWAKAFYDIRTDTSEGNPPKTTGIAFKDLNVYGFGSSTDFQKSVGNIFLEAGTVFKKLLRTRQRRVDILHDLEGVVHSGEMLAVLGPPGSGCSTFLKTGIQLKDMRTAFRGEGIYTAEVDDHFPHLTSGDTLYFAARARCPKNIPDGISRREYAEHLRDVTMAMFGISHTKNTRVGNDFIRGVSGGERRRVTIAEAALSYSPLQCWDNSTRGLDSANALEFCRTLRTQADVMGCTACVAIYQASQDAYDVFDKVVVLYKGRQIFFGKTTEARAYFENLGFVCPEQHTTADFLTSMTSHQERVIRPEWENKTPRTPDEFAQAWKASQHRAHLTDEIDNYLQRHPFGGEHYEKFAMSRKMDQSSSQRLKSPFTLSYMDQMRLTLWRSWVMLLNDPSITLTMLITNLFEALIISSIFYNLQPDTSSMFKRGILIFFIIIMNAFSSILEILTLYAKRKIVEKHGRYALYHPSAEALSSMVVDLPYKIVNCILMNTTLYFMSNLCREPGPFFFLLISFSMAMSMSMMFRFIGSVTKSEAQALAPASILLLAIALYAGFAIPPQYMQDWFGWFRWINPVYYAFESLLVNEFSGRHFFCSDFVPKGSDYDTVEALQRVCSIAGAIHGEDFVDGTAWLVNSFAFQNSHKWRNFAIIFAFMILFMGIHLVASELVASHRSKGEVLVFLRTAMKKVGSSDVEGGSTPRAQMENGTDTEGVSDMERQTSVFHWKDVCYDIKVKGEERRILDHVDGWVEPGTLTALMGVSGAGKTTLLDVLASRVTMGVITGEMLVDGNLCDDSFQRKTGYAQQQDLHLHSSTVREALNFSALLRQPARYSQEEKLTYVETVISMLNMEEYSDAVIGVPGEGLNVEQMKRLTIGVELAARPQLLLFLDEPTSGLDSQTSWSICNLMEKLTRSGQAILCTIHQPSAILFQRFDRLLLLAKGDKTVYFGGIGKNSSTLVDYFVSNGAPDCEPGANPAEYMLHVIGAAPGAHTDIDLPSVWRQSPEYRQVQEELARLSNNKPPKALGETTDDQLVHHEFAAPFKSQFIQVTKRAFHQYWRSPSYIYSKAALSFGAALFIGLSFLNAENTQRGLQNQMFGVFIFLTIFSQMVEQIPPIFVSQRTSANILVEMAWNSLMSAFCFVCWYFPIGLYHIAYHTNSADSRGVTTFLQVWIFFMFASTFAHMMIAGIDTAEVAGGIVNLFMIMMFAFCGVLAGPDDLPRWIFFMFASTSAHMMIAGIDTAEVAGGIVNLFMIMMFAFCGVLAGPDDLPRFWIFMNRVNPFTYVVEAFLGTTLAGAPVHCATSELLQFDPPNGTSCEAYMEPYMAEAGGYLAPSVEGQCSFCPMRTTAAFLENINVEFGNRWRDFGFMWAYCVFNVVVAVGLYWLVRVPKNKEAAVEVAVDS